jgi:hypothetical protein
LYRQHLDIGTVGEYLEILEEPMAGHEDVLWPDNEAFFDTLRKTLTVVCPSSESTSPTTGTGRTLLAN